MEKEIDIWYQLFSWSSKAKNKTKTRTRIIKRIYIKSNQISCLLIYLSINHHSEKLLERSSFQPEVFISKIWRLACLPELSCWISYFCCQKKKKNSLTFTANCNEVNAWLISIMKIDDRTKKWGSSWESMTYGNNFQISFLSHEYEHEY